MAMPDAVAAEAVARAALASDSADADRQDVELGSVKDWPAQQPESPRRARYFCCGRRCGCCPAYALLLPALGIAGCALGAALIAALAALALAAWAVVGCGLSVVLAYFRQWSGDPWRFPKSLYLKMMFLGYQGTLIGRKTPGLGPKDVPVDMLKPKRRLEKVPVAYALNLQVPAAAEEEFSQESPAALSFSQHFRRALVELPMRDTFDTFDEDEDPVAYVMTQLGSVYPRIFQDWVDKRSDAALTRFCLYGIGAHRIESVVEGGERLFVVRANALAGLPVREGFAHYGGDAHFDAAWRPVKIVDAGLNPATDDGMGAEVTTRPFESGWEEAKFRFRSSLSVLVTLVDHLFAIHLEAANLMVTACREQLSPEHPMRRFLVPFMYGTISVNNNAYASLARPRAMAPRCFAFTDQGLRMAFSAAPKLVMSGMEVSADEGGPILNRERYAEYLRERHGIDTEYQRQSTKFWLVCRRFVEDYLRHYYPSTARVLQDPELIAFYRQFSSQMDFVLPPVLQDSASKQRRSEAPITEEETYNCIVDIFANFMFLVTAGHEQAGAVEANVQDVSFCAFKWVPGKLCGTKQTATAQALLMSFTSAPMPALMGSDWSHLFPESSLPPPEGAKAPRRAFEDFQAALRGLAGEAEAYNAMAASRPFPECFPLYTLNPRVMDSSVSV